MRMLIRKPIVQKCLMEVTSRDGSNEFQRERRPMRQLHDPRERAERGANFNRAIHAHWLNEVDVPLAHSANSDNNDLLKMVMVADQMNGNVAAIQRPREYGGQGEKMAEMSMSPCGQMCLRAFPPMKAGELQENGNARERAANGRCLWNTGIFHYRSRKDRVCRRWMRPQLWLLRKRRPFGSAILGDHADREHDRGNPVRAGQHYEALQQGIGGARDGSLSCLRRLDMTDQFRGGNSCCLLDLRPMFLARKMIAALPA